MNDESENDFYDTEILGNRNYHLIDYDIKNLKTILKSMGVIINIIVVEIYNFTK